MAVKQRHYQVLVQHGHDELEVSWMKVIKGFCTLTVTGWKKGGGVNLGSELQYLTIAWSSDVGSSGCGNPPLSVSNKALTRNRVANILQSTWNYHSTYATGFLFLMPNFVLTYATLNGSRDQSSVWVFTTENNNLYGELCQGVAFFCLVFSSDENCSTLLYWPTLWTNQPSSDFLPHFFFFF